MEHLIRAVRMARAARVLVAAGVLVGVLSAAASTAWCADWPQFRGPARDGKSGDTGLLKEWPAGGPTMLWSIDDLGFGYSSATVTSSMLYTTGLEDKTGYVYAYDLNGNRLWKKSYGPDWSGSTPGSRTTPTLDGGLLYVMSGYGRVVCFDAKTGDEKWAVDTKQKFGARNISWGITESLLIDGDNVICTPGGPKACLVALNKKTGDTVWVCDGVNDKSAYCAPIIVERGGKRIIVTLLAKNLIGVDANTGKLLWRHPRDVAYDIHAVSPVYEDGCIYITSGYGGERGEMLELSADGMSITKKWSDSKLDCHHGGVIVLDGHVYGASDRNGRGNWRCLNLKTGELVADIRGVGKGSICYADGMFYGYGENGQVGLINASPTDFRLVSSFKVTMGKQQHWAHPVVANGRLYIRHGKALMVYDVAG